jgi:hypothetical protein
LEFACREFRLKLDKFTLLQQNHFADLRKAIETRREYLTLKIEHIAKEMLKKVDVMQENFRQTYLDKQFEASFSSENFNAERESQHVSDAFREVSNLEMNLAKRVDVHTRILKEIKVKLELFDETQEVKK